MPEAPILRFEQVSKRFGATIAVDAVSLDIGPGEFFALLGPSGCGKTTLMRMAGGFESPDQGRVWIDGADATETPPHRRPVNMMFQSYALFPHMSVADNIAFGLKRAGISRTGTGERVMELLRLVQLQGLEDRKPDQLSGGQKQRAALARALARRPKLLLLDEPLGALDRKLREETQFELKDIQQKLGTAFVLVTHDQDEAMAMADRIAVMREGRIEQVGSPTDIYEAPRSKYVARFIGEINLFDGRVTGMREGAALMETADGTIEAHCGRAMEQGSATTIAVRPERMRFACDELRPPASQGGRGRPTADGDGFRNRLSGTVQDFVYRGDRRIFRIRLNSGALARVSIPAAEPAPPPGASVAIAFDPTACVFVGD